MRYTLLEKSAYPQALERLRRFGEKTAECCAHAPSKRARKSIVFNGN
jgi:hypothetical protein